MQLGRGLRVRWLSRTVLGIGVASLLSDVGHEMATTVLPFLVVTLGGTSAALGVIEGVADGASSFAKLVSGLYSDRLARRKPLAVAGYFLTASGMASFALATQTWHLLVGRAVGWVGRGARTPVRNVLLTEATTPETYGRAFGLERSMDSAGAVIGPLLALGLVGAIGIRPTLALTLLPGLLAALAIATLVRERPHTPRPEQKLWASLQAFPSSYRRFLFGVGIAGLGDFSNTLLILWATQAWTPRFGLAAAARWAMVFYVGYNVVYTVSCSGGRRARRPLPQDTGACLGVPAGCSPRRRTHPPRRFLRQVRRHLRALGRLHGLLGNGGGLGGRGVAPLGGAGRRLWRAGHRQRARRPVLQRARRCAVDLVSSGGDGRGHRPLPHRSGAGGPVRNTSRGLSAPRFREGVVVWPSYFSWLDHRPRTPEVTAQVPSSSLRKLQCVSGSGL